MHINKLIIVIVLFNGLVFSRNWPYNTEENKYVPKNHILDIGAGFGYSYGGLAGGKITISPHKNFALSGAFGTNPPTEPSYNLEARLKMMSPQSKINPHINISYGAYGNIDFEAYGNKVISKTYSGPKIGIGNEFLFGTTKKNAFDFNLLLMIYLADFIDDVNAMRALGSKMDKPSIIKVSIGYHRKFF